MNTRETATQALREVRALISDYEKSADPACLGRAIARLKYAHSLSKKSSGGLKVKDGTPLGPKWANF